MGDYDGALCKLQLVTGSCGAAFKSRVPCGSGTGVSQLGYIGGCSDKATGLDPRDAHAKALIGAVLALKGKQNEALCMVKEAVKLNSHDPRVRSLQGGVLALAGQKDQAICELNEAIRLDRRDSWTYALRSALQRSSGNSMEAANKDYEQAQRYAIMGERVEYLDESPDAISDDIAVNHASESSRTGGASERPPRQAEKTKEPEPQRIVVNILKKMLIAKEREVFHPDYFSKRSRRIQDLSELPEDYKDPRPKPHGRVASREGPGAGWARRSEGFGKLEPIWFDCCTGQLRDPSPITPTIAGMTSPTTQARRGRHERWRNHRSLLDRPLSY